MDFERKHIHMKWLNENKKKRKVKVEEKEEDEDDADKEREKIVTEKKIETDHARYRMQRSITPKTVHQMWLTAQHISADIRYAASS